MPSPSPSPPSRPRSLLLASVLSAALFTRPVRANAEKIIFTGPAPVDMLPLTTTSSIASHHMPSLSDLNLLHVLLADADADANAGAGASSSLRTNLTRVFATEQQHAQPAWFLLGDLAQAQRYELRVCWSALEPTSFTLDVFPPSVVWSTPALLQSLSEYVAHLRPSNEQPSISSWSHESSSSAASASQQYTGHVSAMLLRVQAIADYFSHDKILMKSPPPPVLVDLILDPYIYNLVPRSLLPTAAYLVAVGMAAWFLAHWILGSLISIAGSGSNDRKKKQN